MWAGGLPALPRNRLLLLAGQALPSRAIAREIRACEALGLGASLFYEHYDLEEAVKRSIATGAVTARIAIQTAVINCGTRYSFVTVSGSDAVSRRCARQSRN
jgi:hypothetical protein